MASKGDGHPNSQSIYVWEKQEAWEAFEGPQPCSREVGICDWQGHLLTSRAVFLKVSLPTALGLSGPFSVPPSPPEARSRFWG